MTAPSLAEIVADGERLEEETRIAHRDYPNEPLLHGTVHIERSSFYRTHGPRLLAVASAATELFRALDYTTPGWRDETCVIDENSDEVNVAWCGLENAIDNPRAGQPPEAF